MSTNSFSMMIGTTASTGEVPLLLPGASSIFHAQKALLKEKYKRLF